MIDDQLLTVDQVAEELHLHPQTIRNWIRNGKLRAVKLGHVFRVKREDMEEMIESHTGETSSLGLYRDPWAPETLDPPYRRRGRPRGDSVWDGADKPIRLSKRPKRN
jgi:excisionase family DNA binding protein